MDNGGSSELGGCAMFVKDIAPSRPLVIIINSYLARLNNDIHKTRLEFYKHCLTYNCNAVWIAEEKMNWYLGHEAILIAKLFDLTTPIMPTQIVLLGMSSGGYASGRFAHALAGILKDIRISAYAINPQIGFSSTLLAKAKIASDSCQEFKGQLGANPVVLDLDSARYSIICNASPGLQTEWNELFQSREQPANLLISLHYDRLNPIEWTFAQEVNGWNFVRLMPLDLGAGHAHGCTILGKLFIDNEILGRWHEFQEVDSQSDESISVVYNFQNTCDSLELFRPFN